MTSATTPDTPGDLLDVAVRHAQRAADLLVEGLSRRRTMVRSKSSLTDMVTEMDQAAERQIVEGILGERPDDAVLGEEGARRDGTSGVRWIIDPLDGTTNYLYGHPGFAVSIAAELDGEIVAGVVSDPLHGEVFTAVRGGGARRNGLPIAASTETDPRRALLATGFGYDPRRRVRQAEVLVEVLGLVRDIRRMGAASVDLCSVACGRVDGYWEAGLQPWDYAAGALIAREAGAVVGGLDGGPPSSTFILAAPPALYGPLRELLARARAADV
ncbi:MAG: inositol monophosphatase family protein [Acidimicrobiales bacterium]